MNLLDLLQMLATLGAVVGTIFGAHGVLRVPHGKRWPAIVLVLGMLIAVILLPGALGIATGLGQGPAAPVARAILLGSASAVIVASVALRLRYRRA